MKALIWNDALQSGIMMAGIVAVMIRVIIFAGGTEKVWEAVARGDRDRFLSYVPSAIAYCRFHDLCWKIL